MPLNRRVTIGTALALAAASALSGCAIFQANPSASTCAAAANQVTAAQTALGLAETTLAAVQAGQVKASKTTAQLQADVTAAQTVLSAVTADYAAKCSPVVATPSQPPAVVPQG